MSPNISLSENLFTRLQRHAVPFVDTPESVIARALDALEVGGKAPAPGREGPRHFNPAAPPNLSFTTPRKIILNGHTFPKDDRYWNTLLFACIKEAGVQGCPAQKIADMLVIPHSLGQKDGNGYVYIEEAGISVQGQSSNRAWKQAQIVASALNFSLEVEFVWQNTEKAAIPNGTGLFTIN